MIAKNLHIKIEDGLVKSFHALPNGVEIEWEGEIIQFPSAYLYPGLTDSHGHVSALGAKLNGIDLNFAKSAEECACLAKNSSNTKGNWIVARGWNNELWDNNVFPNKQILDDHFPNNPVFFTRVDGHASWVNSKALEIAGIGNNAKSPEGGKIELDKSGIPTGILHDNAIDLVKNLIPKSTKEQLKNNLLTSCNELLKNGIVNAHDTDVHPEILALYKELDDDNLMPINIFAYSSGHYNEWLDHNISPYQGKNFSIVGVKFYADGSLGSRSAAMLEDYTDKPGERGLFLISQEELFKRATIALKSGFHVAVHAIGDAGNRMVINTYKDLHKNKIADRESVLRLEHAQHINQKDLEKLGKYNIISSVQPIHCISDVATITENRVGNRVKDAYRWKTLIDSGSQLVCGSDFPIESHNPFLGIDALINRIPSGLTNSWNPEERIDLETALMSYSLQPELLVNSINNFHLPNPKTIDNFIIVSQEIDEKNDIKQTKVLATYQNGGFIQH